MDATGEKVSQSRKTVLYSSRFSSSPEEIYTAPLDYAATSVSGFGTVRIIFNLVNAVESDRVEFEATGLRIFILDRIHVVQIETPDAKQANRSVFVSHYHIIRDV